MTEKYYFVAKILKNGRHKVFLFELEGKETLEEVAARNFGEDAVVVEYRIPTQEEKILMSRSMRT